MQHILLIRHAQPDIEADKPAAQWRLSASGRASSRWLAGQIERLQPTRVISSVEPKAQETGQIIAEALGLPLATLPGLHEHEREKQAELVSQDEFRKQLQTFFRQPDQLVLGHETAQQAHSRFKRAVQTAVRAHPNDTLAIATHGRVITLLVAYANALAPMSFWQQLTLPACIVLSLPDFCLIDVIACRDH